MILVDTSVWVDHLRTGVSQLAEALDSEFVLGHPFVIGELALGNLRRRDEILGALVRLPSARVAAQLEVIHIIEQNALYGLGIGYVDAHLVASTLLTPETVLWTRDRRLKKVAETLDLSFAK
jgi:predicted nucleic acid-binding protein